MKFVLDFELDDPVEVLRGELKERFPSRAPKDGDGEVIRLERAPELVAVDLDQGVIKSIAVPVEALGDLVKLLRFFWHLIHAKEYRITNEKIPMSQIAVNAS